MLESGKRYIWHIFHRIHRSGIFTGNYDKNGNGIFIEDETGETWVDFPACVTITFERIQ